MSLASVAHPLASAAAQLRVLNDEPRARRPFTEALATSGLTPLTATGITVFQINVGKLCNQTCGHCHTEIPTVDITGGAPELNPNFRWLVEQSRALGRHVMDRCNLTVLLLASQTDLARFLAAHQVEIVASLPYYLEQQTDAQRGAGVFGSSIEALRKLNALGYGHEGSGLRLDLVYNPVGAFLPPAQHSVEADFKRELARRHGIVFNSLYTITNMPISRFLEFLLRSGNYERYMDKLVNAYNPVAAAGVMCRYTLSVGWDGTLYDCDFNQMLDLPLGFGAPAHIRDFNTALLDGRRITVGQHCYGCTAGSGSSCGGVTA